MQFLFAAAWACTALGAEPDSTSREPAPEFEARLLGSATRGNLVELRGHAILLNAWATWCAPCLQELPAFEAAFRRHRSAGLVVIGVNIDQGGADGRVQEYVNAMGLSFTIWRDPANRFATRFNVRGVPATLLIDRAGRVVRRWSGPVDPESPDTRRLIDSVLATESSYAGR